VATPLFLIVVDAAEKEKESRSPVVEGVRGHAARTHQGASDNTPDPPDSTVNVYADELAGHGYQLHDRLHAGVILYRVSRLPRQQCDVTSSRQSAAKVGTRKPPVRRSLITSSPAVDCVELQVVWSSDLVVVIFISL